MSRNIVAVTLVLIGFSVTTAHAVPITFNGSSGGRTASATFDTSGGNLVVKLTNTLNADATLPIDILTGVYFDLAGNPFLTRVSAKVDVGSSLFNIGSVTNITPADRIVGGEWAYKSAANLLNTSDYGLSAAGLGIFGTGDLFPQPNALAVSGGGTPPDGIGYGITTLGDDVTTGNGGIMGRPMIKATMVFELGGFAGNPFTSVSNVFFQYGTAIDEPQFTGSLTPEPSTLALTSFAVAGLAALAIRKRRVPCECAS